MIKFFRKYNKVLLAVVTGLLMIVFLGGTALTALVSPSPEGAVIAHAYNKKITQGDQQNITGQTNILSRLGPMFQWNRPWGFDFQLPPLSELDYLLLIKEAERNGAVPDLERSRALLSMMGRDLTAFTLQWRISTRQLEEAVANYMMVTDSWDQIQRVARASELDLNTAVRARYQKVRSSLVAIDAEPFMQVDETIPESELQAQFDKYKDRLAGANRMDFGYRVSEKVRLQYIKIDASLIQSLTTTTRRMAERYWSEHKTEFLKPADAEEAAEGEEEEPASPYYETFDAAEADVLLALNNQAQLDEARGLAQTLRGHLAESWYAQPMGDDNYPIPPEGVDAQGYYDATIEQLRGSLQFVDSIAIETTALVTREEAAELPGIGAAREDLEAAAGARWFRTLSHQVQGLVERKQEQTADDSLALYQTCQVPMIDDDNNLYLYRIIETAPARAPSDLAEVRDRVIEDVRMQRAFDRAQAAAQAFLDQYEGNDLLEAWEAYSGMDAELKSTAASAYETSAFPRTTGTPFPVAVRDIDITREDHLIRSNEFVEAAYDLLDAKGPEAHGLIAAPELEKCFVIKLNGQLLLTPDDFNRYRGQVETLVMRDRLDQLKREWFNSERIQARTGFAVVRSDS